MQISQDIDTLLKDVPNGDRNFPRRHQLGYLSDNAMLMFGFGR